METWTSRNWDEDHIGILHSGDFTGEVQITRPIEATMFGTKMTDTVAFADDCGYPVELKNTDYDMNDVALVKMYVPAEVLRDFVLDLLRQGAINRLEEMTPDELADYFAKR